MVLCHGIVSSELRSCIPTGTIAIPPRSLSPSIVSVCLPGLAPTCDYGLCHASYSFECEILIDCVREAKACRDRSPLMGDWPDANPNLPAGMGLGQLQPLHRLILRRIALTGGKFCSSVIRFDDREVLWTQWKHGLHAVVRDSGIAVPLQCDRDHMDQPSRCCQSSTTSVAED